MGPARGHDVLADPVGVIVDVGHRGASRGWTRDVVAGVVEPPLLRAGTSGAASPRRWPSVPAVLTDGRSPAPRVAGSLLIALRRAGAVSVSAPGLRRAAASRCAPCNAAARTGTAESAVPPRTRCVGCGNIRKITSRDRQRTTPLPRLPAR